MERFFALLTKEKIKNDEPDFLIHLLTCLNKDSSVLLKLFEQVNKLSIKPMVLTFINTMHMRTIPVIEWNL